MAKKARSTFDPKVFLATVNHGRTITSHRKDSSVFRQTGPADAVFYLQKGRIKLVVASEQGKEAVVAILGPGEFFGEGCLIGQPLRLATARAMVESEVMRVSKAEMIRVLHDEPAFAELFSGHLLTRNSRAKRTSPTTVQLALFCSSPTSARMARRSRSPRRSARRRWRRSSARPVLGLTSS